MKSAALLLLPLFFLAACGVGEEPGTREPANGNPPPSESKPAPPPESVDAELLGRIAEFRRVLDATQLTDHGGGWHDTGFNFRVSERCVKLAGSRDRALQWIQSTLLEGATCLSRLATDTSKDHLNRLRALIANAKAPVKLACVEMPLQSAESLAAATVPGDAAHPMITFKPARFEAQSLDDRKVTLFHELFHNFGYQHFLHVEYPYACESCCFPGKYSNKAVLEAACQVCRTKYASIDRKEYLRDVTKFLKLDYDGPRAAEILERYLKNHRDDREFLLQLPELYQIHNDAYAYQLANRLKRELRDLTDKEKAALTEIPYPKLPVAMVMAAGSLADIFLQQMNGKHDEILRHLKDMADLKFEASSDKKETWTASSLNKMARRAALDLFQHYDTLAARARTENERNEFEDRRDEVAQLLLKHWK